MGFLDNSGDIILDAVLTDAGRQRLARADGTFKIVQFALGDDEINYALYDKNNASGSAFYDLTILQTPVFEAFTNNIASLNSKLLTIPRNDLLYLPVMKLYDIQNKGFTDETDPVIANSYVVLVDQTTENIWSNIPIPTKGTFFGYTLSTDTSVRIDQGIDTAAAGNQQRAIDADLKETQYTIEIDNRFGIIYSPTTTSTSNLKDATKSFVDDDNIAQYYFSLGVAGDADYVKSIPLVTTNQVIAGPVGSFINFKIRTAQDLEVGTYLFDLLGLDYSYYGTNFKVIKSNVIITGATTGYSISIPVSYVKYIP